MQHLSGPVHASNERIIIWAAFGFEEEDCVNFIIGKVYHMLAWQSVEHDFVNKLSVPFKQQDRDKIWWKLDKWFQKSCLKMSWFYTCTQYMVRRESL